MGTEEKGGRRQGKRTVNDSGDRLVSVSGTVPNSTCQTPGGYTEKELFDGQADGVTARQKF